MHTQILPFTPAQKDELITLWERSVRATHDFLRPADMATIKGFLSDFDFTAVPSFCLMAQERMLGFIVLDKDKINALFIDPAHIGKGYGRQLMNYVLAQFDVNFVDVNEQNHRAKAFYEKYGFSVFNRIDEDDFGYPLLQMRRIL